MTAVKEIVIISVLYTEKNEKIGKLLCSVPFRSSKPVNKMNEK